MTARQPNQPIRPRNNTPIRETPAPQITVSPRDLSRQRAEIAWQNIQAVKEKIYQDQYSSLVSKMPTLIQVNGLAQTIAFLKAKGKEHHTEALANLSSWFCIRYNWETGTEILNKVINMNNQSYRLATVEALAFLQWLKRFSEAELTSQEND